jgi:hypothetical protein
MTLVLGYADEEIGFLVSDSLLTLTVPNNFETGPVAGQYHGLKIQIIRPDVAIAFASRNDADGALKLIMDLAKELPGSETNRVSERLFETYKMSIDSADGAPPDSEFLVLRITARGKELAHITTAGVRSCSRAYIGDQAEYIKLKGLPASYSPPKTQIIVDQSGEALAIPLQVSDGEREFAEVSDAMEALVHRRKGSVGAIAGCIIRVVDARISGTFEYMQDVEVSRNPWEGESGFSLLASNTGIRGIGIYYRSGNVGFILKVCDSEHVHKERAETIDDFIRIAKTKYDLNLDGGFWATSTS